MDTYQILSSAVERNAGKSMRSEDLADYSDYLADPVGLALLAGNDNAVIFGRRGAGKTIVTGALVEEVNRGAFGERVIAFRYSADSFRTSAQFESSARKVKDEARAYFNVFLQSLLVDLSDIGTARLFEDSRWSDGFTRRGEENRKRREDFLQLLTRYDELVRYGVSPGDPQTVTHTRKQTETHAQDRGRLLKGELNLPLPRSPYAGLQWSGSRKDDVSRVESDSVEMSFQRRFAPATIRDLIVKTIQFMGLDYIIIVIDEWMTLADCQVEFAERLKRTLFGDRHIAVKMAADQYQCAFNNGGANSNIRGFEIGADANVATDLDLPFSNPERRGDLFALALYKRLVKFEPAVATVFGPADKRFIASIFSTRRAFNELCIASNGLCRDFFILFRLCTKELEFTLSSSKKIDIEIVRTAILENYKSTFNRALENVNVRFLLFEVIMKHLKAVQSRFFLVPNAQGGRNNPAIRDLLSKRFIYHVPPTEIPEGLRTDYSCFGLEYGMYVEMMRTVEYSTGKGVDDISGDEISRITAMNAPTFVIDLSTLAELGGDESSICSECGASYLLADRHVLKLGVCPYCLEPIVQESLR